LSCVEVSVVQLYATEMHGFLDTAVYLGSALKQWRNNAKLQYCPDYVLHPYNPDPPTCTKRYTSFIHHAVLNYQ